ncbi:TetR/AcrR family transcriptional regulator [Mycobacterium deserti]|uniref:TetR family transcriptional regulator n=1 Tax=Mycobacterium deserti TaxID=2978347 RepID=A0ABT2M9W5_9MYCO|nr:TetR/AcrR family transcriptional regulator [Mycobacterium deserti]MCT7659053.1 TetR family transcriptional regulator [Mycobacterium deserti]
MTDQIDRRSDTTRQQILRAASHQFAHRSYSRVSLDDILADAEVTKGAMYFHFRSKHALAAAIVEQCAAGARGAVEGLLARRLSGLETLIDMSYLIAIDDIGDESARAGLNLLESIGRTDGLQLSILGDWVAALAAIAQKAVEEGDIPQRHDPEAVARLLVSMYMGLRQASDLAKPERFLADLQEAWALILPGFVDGDRVDYLQEFIKRRTAVAVKKATPL